MNETKLFKCDICGKLLSEDQFIRPISDYLLNICKDCNIDEDQGIDFNEDSPWIHF